MSVFAGGFVSYPVTQMRNIKGLPARPREPKHRQPMGGAGWRHVTPQRSSCYRDADHENPSCVSACIMCVCVNPLSKRGLYPQPGGDARVSGGYLHANDGERRAEHRAAESPLLFNSAHQPSGKHTLICVCLIIS